MAWVSRARLAELEGAELENAAHRARARSQINPNYITAGTFTAAHLTTKLDGPPKGLERLVPGVTKYTSTGGLSAPRWDREAIERDLKRLDTYEDCNAGEALAKHLQEAEEYTGPGFWTNGMPPSWWDLRAPENSQSVTNNFTPCCDHADTQKEDK